MSEDSMVVGLTSLKHSGFEHAHHTIIIHASSVYQERLDSRDMV